ncbi:MAG: MFS transporter [Myxococcota bacterium]
MLVFGFLSFLGFGLVLVLVGANQEPLARQLSLGLADSGLLVSTLSLGLGAGVVGAGPLFDRHPRRPLLVGAMALAAASLGTVRPDMTFERWLLHLAGAGAGIGAYGTFLNASIVERFGTSAARPMSVLHAAATLGAIAGPPGAAWLGAEGDWIRSFHAVGALHAALALAALTVPLGARDAAGPPPDADDDRGRIGWALLPFALVAFAYVGIEGTLTVFAVPYAEHLTLPAGRGQLAISAFWLGLLVGRTGVLALGTALDARMLLVAGAAGAGVIALATGLPVGRVEVAFFASGACLGCVYPLTITLAGQAFPHARGTAAGLAGGAGALGGFAIPWIAGALGDAGGAGVAVASTAGFSLLIAAAAGLAMRAR